MKNLILVAFFITLSTSVLHAKPPKKKAAPKPVETFVLRSKINRATTGKMALIRNEKNEVIITASTVPADSNDRSVIYYFNGATYDGTRINIPNDGKPYWIINFDPNANPIVTYVYSGGIEAVCACLPAACISENCRKETLLGLIICSGICMSIGTEMGDPDTCESTCGFHNTIVVIQAESLFYNGRKYIRN